MRSARRDEHYVAWAQALLFALDLEPQGPRAKLVTLVLPGVDMASRAYAAAVIRGFVPQEFAVIVPTSLAKRETLTEDHPAITGSGHGSRL